MGTVTVEVEPEIKYAAQLCALDLGSTMRLKARSPVGSGLRTMVLKKVRKIEHHGPNFGSHDKKNTIWIYGVGYTAIAKYDTEVEVTHGR